MNNNNNSPMDSLNNLNNEPVTPVEPTPVPGDNPIVAEQVATPMEEVVPTPVEEPTPLNSEPVADITPTEEPINPIGEPINSVGEVTTEPIAVNEGPVGDNPVSGNDVVTLTPGEENKEGEASVNDLSQAPATAVALGNDVTPSNPVADNPIPNPVAGNDQTAVGFQEKKSSGAKLKTPLIIVAALVVLGALGYFVVLPFVKNTFMVTPKKVFENTLTSLKTQINNTLSDANITNTMNDISINIDTNMDEMKEFKDFTYGVRFGIDNKAKALEGKAYMLDKNNKEYNVIGYTKGEDILVKLSSDDRLVKVGKTTDIEGFNDIFDATENINIDDYSYFTNKVVDSVFSTFDEKDFVKEDSTIKVNNEEIKVKKNTYVLNKERIKKLYTTVVNDIYNDSKCMELVSTWGMTKEEYKKILIDEVNFDDIKDEDAINVNLYINSKNEVVGFDIANNKGEKPVYYYSNEGNFNLFIGDPTGKDSSDNMTLDGVKNGDATDVTYKIGNDVMATFKVYVWTEEEKKFDFNIPTSSSGSEQDVSGSIDLKFTKNNSANNINLQATLKSGSESIGFTLNLKQELNAKIADIDASKAVTLSDEDMNKWTEDFLKSLDDTPFGFYNDLLESASQQPIYSDKTLTDDETEYDYGF